MDGRENHVVLVLGGDSRLIARHGRRIERQVGEEALARRVLRREVLELFEIAHAAERRIVEALELRLVPITHEPNLSGPRRGRIRKLFHEHAESLPIHFRELRSIEVGKALDGKALRLEMLEHLLGMGGTDAGNELEHTESRDAVAWIIAPT